MTAIIWILRFVVFAVLILFAIQNTALVNLKLAADYQWEAPLVVILLVFFAAGTLLGMLALAGKVFQQGREISRLKREVERAEMARVENLLQAPSPDRDKTLDGAV
ncbi:LapA family protein [Azonexus sp.]|uniref:LapA family protein n=1 Tax=Azonexus sp. TaxID=1872668 RepID=UPI0039E46D12